MVLLFSTALSLKGKREPTSAVAKAKKYLYVAVPGIRNYLEYGGHGILVFDIDNNYKLVKDFKQEMLSLCSRKVVIGWQTSHSVVKYRSRATLQPLRELLLSESRNASSS